MKVLFRALSALMVVSSFAVLISGCGRAGGSGGKVGVEGKVNYKGAPVTGGKLTLHHPKEGTYPININNDGSFSNSDLDEKMIGEVVVTIDTSEYKNQQQGADNMPTAPGKGGKGGGASDAFAKGGKKMMPEGKAVMPKYVAIPPKYADSKQSDLKWNIKAGKNEMTFDLKD
jgi:hypothetical protein